MKPKLKRHEKWEIALREQFETAFDAVFFWSEFDCCQWPASCVMAMTGADLLGGLPGYTTAIGAARAIRKYGGSDLEAAAEKLFEAAGCIECAPAFARRGDVVLLKLEGRLTMGVVDLTGRFVAAPNEAGGLAKLPVLSAERAWMVG